MKFKLEISLLLSAILLYVLSAFCYSYESSSQEWAQYMVTPHRVYAFPLTAIGSVFLAVAAILYSRRK